MRTLFLILVLLLTAGPAVAQPITSITYQGQLQESSGLHDGSPDMEFRLFDSLTLGNQIGVTVDLSAVPVTDGLFQVELDFVQGAVESLDEIFDGSPRFLQIRVNNELLSPRQAIASTPYAMHASFAAVAEVADSVEFVTVVAAGPSIGANNFGSRAVDCPVSHPVAVACGIDLSNVFTMVVTSIAPRFSGSRLILATPGTYTNEPDGCQGVARNNGTTTQDPGFHVSATCRRD